MVYIVVGERTDKGTVHRVFWSQRNRDPLAPVEFTCHEEDAVVFHIKRKALQCIAFLTEQRRMEDGFIEREPCCSGSNPVFNLTAVETQHSESKTACLDRGEGQT